MPLTDEADRAAFAELVAPLDEVPVAVEVVSVEEPEDDDRGDRDARLAVGARRAATWDYEYHRRRWCRPRAGWQVDWAPEALVPDLADGDTLGLRTLAPQRGDITGAGGAVLVTERPVLRYGLDKTKVEGPQVARSARRIARVLGVDAASYVERAEAMGPAAFVEALVLREDDALDVLPAFTEGPGALAVRDTLPLAPTREFAAAAARPRRPGDRRAGGGVRRAHRGRRPGRPLRPAGALRRAARREPRDSGRRPRRRRTQLRTARSRSPRPTEPTWRTTIAPDLQQRAERALATLGADAPASALVAIRPSDGAVLATANGAGAAGADLANAGQYAPGSTFKVVSALALLRSGLGGRRRGLLPGDDRRGRASFKNYDDYPASSIGEITLAAGRRAVLQHRLHRQRRPPAAG